MALGDSLTWGAGLAPEQRYTNVTEVIINNKSQTPKVEILNFAYSGAPTVLERDLLVKLYSKIKPDLIVIGFCYNDPLPHMSGIWPEKNRLARLLSILSRPLNWIGLDKSTNFLIHKIFINIAETTKIISSHADAVDRLYDKNSDEWLSFKSALQDINNISNKLNLPQPVFLVLNQGVYHNKPTSFTNPDNRTKRFLAWYHQAEELADDIGFVTYNFENEFSNELYGKPLAINELDGHPNALVNTFYAKKLASHITNLLNSANE